LPDLIKFRCKACDKKIGVRAEYAGKKAKCPGCQSVLRVPAGDTTQSQDALEPYPLQGETDLEEVDDEIVQDLARLCPSCRSKQPDGAVVCMACGTELNTGKKLKTVVQTAPESPDGNPKSPHIVDRKNYITIGALMFGVSACFILLKLLRTMLNGDRPPKAYEAYTPVWISITFALFTMVPAAALIWISRQKPIDLRQKNIRTANFVVGGSLVLLALCLCFYSIYSYEYGKGFSYQDMARRLVFGILMIVGGAKFILDGALSRSYRISFK